MLLPLTKEPVQGRHNIKELDHILHNFTTVTLLQVVKQCVLVFIPEMSARCNTVPPRLPSSPTPRLRRRAGRWRPRRGSGCPPPRTGPSASTTPCSRSARGGASQSSSSYWRLCCRLRWLMSQVRVGGIGTHIHYMQKEGTSEIWKIPNLR